MDIDTNKPNFISEWPADNTYDCVIVGCGLSGAVVAERLATQHNKRVLIVEKRSHIAGNCYDYRNEFGLLMNMYGAHLFHTNYEHVWDYINKFAEWQRWEHRVLALVDGQFVSVPPNITTVNQLCGESLTDESEMDAWLKTVQVQYQGPAKNSEEMAKSRVGELLYEKMFKHYTKKQWDVYPDQLDPSVLARIPLRNDFDTRYFSDRFQALPKQGYTHFFERLLSHPRIIILLNCNFLEMRHSDRSNCHCPIIYTGPIDQYFGDKGLPVLHYRSLDFHIENYQNMNFYQPNSVVNYPSQEPDFTRIVEYKHFLNQSSPHTTIVKEYSKPDGDPYYPIPNSRNQELYERYREYSNDESGVYFLGRLANYKYFNMDQAIHNALEFFEHTFDNDHCKKD